MRPTLNTCFKVEQYIFSLSLRLSQRLQRPREVFGAIAQKVSGVVFVPVWEDAGGDFFLFS